MLCTKICNVLGLYTYALVRRRLCDSIIKRSTKPSKRETTRHSASYRKCCVYKASCSALEAICDDALHKSTSLLYLLTSRRRFWHATLRLRSAIRRHHPPQRAVLSQICCFGERKVMLFQILLDGAEPRDTGTTWLSSPVCRRGS